MGQNLYLYKKKQQQRNKLNLKTKGVIPWTLIKLAQLSYLLSIFTWDKSTCEANHVETEQQSCYVKDLPKMPLKETE